MMPSTNCPLNQIYGSGISARGILLSRAKGSLLKRLYYNLESPACYSSIEQILRTAHNPKFGGLVGKGVTREDVRIFLSTQSTYTRHRRAVRKFRRLPAGLHTDWQADLAIFDSLATQNDGYKYLLVCVDVLSRRVFVEPVRSKRAVDMITAFERIFIKSRGIRPWKLTTDQGLEFNARAMLEYFEKKDIRKQCNYSHPIVHAGVVERMNRTIKERLFRYLSQRNTSRWVDVIDRIADAINATKCRSTGVAPNHFTFENATQLRQQIYGRIVSEMRAVQVHPSFKVGDAVRIEKQKGKFAKGYAPNFTDEIFRVTQVHSTTQPPVYRLSDSRGNVLRGWFYAQEMCHTHEADTMYRIERIIRSRTNRASGEREHFVKWEGYDSTYNEWVRAVDLMPYAKNG